MSTLVACGRDRQEAATEQGYPVYVHQAPAISEVVAPAPPPVPSIDHLVLTVAVECRPIPPAPRLVWDERYQQWMEVSEEAPVLDQAPRMGTGAKITLSDGTFVRFSDSASKRPGMHEDPSSGNLVLTLEYRPLEGDGLLGQPLTRLTAFESVRFNYSKVLSAHDLEYLGVNRAFLTVNGREIPLAVDTTPDDRESWKFDDQFRSAARDFERESMFQG